MGCPSPGPLELGCEFAWVPPQKRRKAKAVLLVTPAGDISSHPAHHHSPCSLLRRVVPCYEGGTPSQRCPEELVQGCINLPCIPWATPALMQLTCKCLVETLRCTQGTSATYRSPNLNLPCLRSLAAGEPFFAGWYYTAGLRQVLMVTWFSSLS